MLASSAVHSNTTKGGQGKGDDDCLAMPWDFKTEGPGGMDTMIGPERLAASEVTGGNRSQGPQQQSRGNPTIVGRPEWQE